MVARENVAKQHHLDLCESGHASAHDLHPSPHRGPGKVLPRHTQKLVIASLSKPEA